MDDSLAGMDNIVVENVDEAEAATKIQAVFKGINARNGYKQNMSIIKETHSTYSTKSRWIQWSL